MSSETTTPNIGLQIPAFNQANWQVPTNYNWNLLDKIFGGEITVPALSVVNLTIENIGSIIAGIFVTEVPTGSIPGNTFTFSFTPSVLFGFYVNGIFQRPGIDYDMATNILTLGYSLSSGDAVYAVYLR